MAKEKIKDFVSGLMVDDNPEEIFAVQPFSKILVEDYNYPKHELQTHPQLYVKANPSDKRGYPVDIAVYENRGTKKEKLKIVVECKRPTREDGREQLELYLKFCEASIGIWYNGKDSLYLKKIEHSGNISFEEIPAIPSYKETLDEIGLYRRENLKKTHNLKDVFLEIRGYLVGNATGTTRDEFIAKQMINLVLCKIFDERFPTDNFLLDFRTSISDSDEEVFERINILFDKVKAKYKDVLDITDQIELDAKSLRHVVGKLQRFCVTECERDVVSDAFEVFIGYSLKGEQGQFFTPSNISRLMVELIHPSADKNEIIMDPACGSGGFLVESLRYLWKQIDEKAKKYNWSGSATEEEKKEAGIKLIRGIDKDSFLTKVAKSYMAILGDGKGGIFCEDSLDLFEKWNPLTQQHIKPESFDVILTNPPFGKNIKIVGKEKLNQYELAKKITSEGKTQLVDEGNVSTLFLERAIQLLKKGGRLGIILPESYFHAPKQNYVLEYIFRDNNITHVIDLPQNTFRPHNNAKCIVLILEKGVKQQDKIKMAVAEQVGHDHQGKPIYRLDNSGKPTKNIWDDIPEILKEFLDDSIPPKYTFEVEFNKINERKILVPRYYWSTKQENIDVSAAENGLSLISLKQLMEENVITCFDGNGSPQSQFKGTGHIPYVRVKDIVNWQMYTDVTALIPDSEYKRLYKEEKQLKPKDILFVRRGSYRIGSVAMVSPYDLKCILTREILVIRVIDEKNKYGITPEYLMYALSHKIVAAEAVNKIFIDTTLPNIGDRWKELKIPIPIDDEKLTSLTKMMKSIVNHHWKAQKEIENCRKNYDIYSA